MYAARTRPERLPVRSPARPLSFRRRIPAPAAKPVAVPVASRRIPRHRPRRIPRARKPSCLWFFAPPRSRSRVSFPLSEASNVTALPTLRILCPSSRDRIFCFMGYTATLCLKTVIFAVFRRVISPLRPTLREFVFTVPHRSRTKCALFHRFPSLSISVRSTARHSFFVFDFFYGIFHHFCITCSCSRARSRFLFPTSFHLSFSPFPSRPARSSFSRKALYI